VLAAWRDLPRAVADSLGVLAAIIAIADARGDCSVPVIASTAMHLTPMRPRKLVFVAIISPGSQMPDDTREISQTECTMTPSRCGGFRIDIEQPEDDFRGINRHSKALHRSGPILLRADALMVLPTFGNKFFMVLLPSFRNWG